MELPAIFDGPPPPLRPARTADRFEVLGRVMDRFPEQPFTLIVEIVTFTLEQYERRCAAAQVDWDAEEPAVNNYRAGWPS